MLVEVRIGVWEKGESQLNCKSLTFHPLAKPVGVRLAPLENVGPGGKRGALQILRADVP